MLVLHYGSYGANDLKPNRTGMDVILKLIKEHISYGNSIDFLGKRFADLYSIKAMVITEK